MKLIFFKITVFFMITLIVLSCSKETEILKKLTITNSLDKPRTFETVEISKESLQLNSSIVIEQLGVRDSETGKILVSQLVDKDNDGNLDAILFQPEMEVLSEKKFELIKLESVTTGTDSIPSCYSRFVPERTDDYAWENNIVAFRTYGPKAQQMTEQYIQGGTLTSGIDGWLKKVDYPIINKWYEKTVSEKGSYHEDTGEGLDNFHVGGSRGIGGVAVKKDSVYYVSKNFTNWKTISTGPIRTSFVLSYANWDADGNVITEEKHISLDYGSHLTRYEISITGTDTLSVGLTLHENDGDIKTQVDNGWVSYWEPHEGSELGTAILAPKGIMVGFENYKNTSFPDQSNLYAHLKISNNSLIYYAGFAWKESEHIQTSKAWELYLNDFADKINNPLKVVINE